MVSRRTGTGKKGVGVRNLISCYGSRSSEISRRPSPMGGAGKAAKGRAAKKEKAAHAQAKAPKKKRPRP